MEQPQLSRRSIFKLIAASAAASSIPIAHGAPPKPLTRHFKNTLSDPDFNSRTLPWEKPLVETELATLAVLVDLILPADEKSPAATAIGLPDFINEWVGAPYAENREDYETIRGGLAWLNTHTWQLHGKPFTAVSPTQQTAILDRICDPAKAAPELAHGARFFSKLRMLSLGGYYTHPLTWESLGYVGNRPSMGAYPGVPDEVIRLLGLEGL